MPSPSKTALVSGLVITAGIMFSGAWLASGMTSADGDAIAENARARPTMPLLAPIPGAAQDAVPTPQRISAPQSQDIAISNEAPSAGSDAAAVPAALQVTINGVRNDSGKILVFVFDTKAAYDAYDYTQAVGYAELDASTEPITHTFADLTDGPYAIGLFHDENANQDFDMQGQLPTEGYGTSGASNAYDEPSFRKASVEAGPVSIQVHYLQ